MRCLGETPHALASAPIGELLYLEIYSGTRAWVVERVSDTHYRDVAIIKTQLGCTPRLSDCSSDAHSMRITICVQGSLYLLDPDDEAYGVACALIAQHALTGGDI